MSLLTPPRLVIPSTRSLPLRPATQFNPHSGRRGHGLVQLILSVPSRLRRPHPSACPCGATPRLKCSALSDFDRGTLEWITYQMLIDLASRPRRSAQLHSLKLEEELIGA